MRKPIIALFALAIISLFGTQCWAATCEAKRDKALRFLILSVVNQRVISPNLAGRVNSL